MFWNKKNEKDGLPDLPPSPLPLQSKPSLTTYPDKPQIFQSEEEDIDNITGEKHALPSFPDSPISKGFSQAAIKDAVSIESKDDSIEVHEFPEIANDKRFKTIEMDSDDHFPSLSHPTIQTRPSIIEPPPIENRILDNSDKSERFSSAPPKSDGSNVFVKIDKFRSARKSLEEINYRVEEIDELLKKIRETKLREEQELTAWEKEVTTIKSRLQNVTENIFEKIE